MNTCQSMKIFIDINQRMKTCELSPNDEYLSIVSSQRLDNQKKKYLIHVQIIDLLNINTIIVMQAEKSKSIILRKPLIRFSNDSRCFYLCGDYAIQCISIAKRKQIFSFRLGDKYTECFIDLNYGLLLFAAMTDIKIFRRNKIIRSMNTHALSIPFDYLDYNPLNYLLLFDNGIKITIISIITLKIIYILSISSINTMFFKDCMLTLEDSDDQNDENNGQELNLWKINQKNQSIMREMQCLNVLKLGKSTHTYAFEVGLQNNYIVLFCRKEILIIDQNFLIIQTIICNPVENFLIQFRWQQISKNKICSRTECGVEIFTPSKIQYLIQ